MAHACLQGDMMQSCHFPQENHCTPSLTMWTLWCCKAGPMPTKRTMLCLPHQYHHTLVRWLWIHHTAVQSSSLPWTLLHPNALLESERHGAQLWNLHASNIESDNHRSLSTLWQQLFKGIHASKILSPCEHVVHTLSHIWGDKIPYRGGKKLALSPFELLFS